MTGCTNPAAANYTPGSHDDNGSCLYVKKVAGTCYLFREPTDNTREDFTCSYSLLVGDWVFFHGYIPDKYVVTRDQLYSLKNNQLYKHNKGPFGVYYSTTPQSFFIDLVVTERKETILASLQWVTEVLDAAGKDKEHLTFTHVTIWNNYQCSGRVPVSKIFRNLSNQTSRKTKGTWNFNDFRDVLKNNEDGFLKSIFEDFAVDTTKIDVNLPWYERQLLVDDHFIIRLEYDNTENYNIILHQVGATMNNSY
jgi:hypothetical protein